MLAELTHRLLRRAPAIAPARRTESCPPGLLHAAARADSGWRSGFRQWLASGWQTARSEPASGLVRARDEFLQALEDIRTPPAELLELRIRGARSLRELWHWRAEVFRQVSLHHSQAEAQARLDRLNRHFPTRSPRSGFSPLEGSAAVPRRRG